MKIMTSSLVRLLLLMCAMLLVIVLIFSFQKSKIVYDENILFVVDVSNSMNVQDVNGVDGVKGVNGVEKISRLDAVKEIIEKIVHSDSSANYGLVVFSQIAYQLVPLTHDTGTFLDYAENINTSILPGGGTNWNSLGKIFSLSGSGLGNSSPYSKIIFFSDSGIGGKIQKWKGIENAQNYFIGLGTREGERVRYANGNIVRDKGIKVKGIYEVQNAQLLAQQLNAKLYSLTNLDTIESIVEEIADSNSRFPFAGPRPFAQIQILLTLLGLFILFVL